MAWMSGAWQSWQGWAQDPQTPPSTSGSATFLTTSSGSMTKSKPALPFNFEHLPFSLERAMGRESKQNPSKCKQDYRGAELRREVAAVSRAQKNYISVMYFLATCKTQLAFLAPSLFFEPDGVLSPK